jgi:hypothetical protein
MRRHGAVLPLVLSAGVAAAFHAPCSAQTADPPGRTSERATSGRIETSSASAPDARDAFLRLKSLAGTWQGQGSDAASGAVFAPNSSAEYRVTGAGSVLTELANAGTADEMLSVFHLDGDRLILQHYCSAGSQPRLQLVRADSTGLWFDLTGGTGFDPAHDGHIHSARFIIGPDRVESFWTWFDGGRSDHTARRLAHRVR